MTESEHEGQLCFISETSRINAAASPGEVLGKGQSCLYLQKLEAGSAHISLPGKQWDLTEK